MGRADMRLYPVRIVAIDGDYTVDRDTVRAEPGQRTLRLLAAPVAGFTQPVEKDVPFTIEPCKRYYLAARREAPLRQDFQLVVQQVEQPVSVVQLLTQTQIRTLNLLHLQLQQQPQVPQHHR